MGDLDDFLVVEPSGAPLNGESFLSPARPTVAGLQWLDAPWGKSSGLAYRMNGPYVVERLSVKENDGSSTNATVINQLQLSVGAVRIASSPDGRMVAVACCDGSLHCLDSTSSSMSLRWTISDCHTHVAPESGDVSSPISSDRSNAACASGPVLSLEFSPENYMLILLDARRGFAMYDAREESPINIITTQQSNSVLWNVSCATWYKALDKGNVRYLAIGRYDGTTAILKQAGDQTAFEVASELGRPTEEVGYTCTHLNWSTDALAVGLCRVIIPDNGEDYDEEGEKDDAADHEAILYLTTIDEDVTLAKATEWMEQEEVVPFFSVPKSGRHVFFTSFLRSSSQSLFSVAANVGTDVGGVASNGREWSVVEFQEGAAAAFPTTQSDEFTYPLGIVTIQLQSSSFRLLIAATDGSLSTFEYKSINDPECFVAVILGDGNDLPCNPVDLVHSSSATRPSQEPPKYTAKSSEDGGTWVVVDKSTKNNESDSAEELSTILSSSPSPVENEEAPSGSTLYGTAEASSFPSFLVPGKSSTDTIIASSSNPTVFGSGTSAPDFSFGSAASAPTFGVTSSVGQTTSIFVKESSAQSSSSVISPNFDSSRTFGLGSSISTGGFAAIASSMKSPSGGGTSMAPFNAFTKTPEKESQMFSSFANPLLASTRSEFTALAGKPFNDDSSEQRAKGLTGSDTEADGVATKQMESNPPLLNSDEAASEIRHTGNLLYGSLEKASEAFDQCDTNRNGFVPVTSFGDLLEILGEGFHGDEYDAQLSLVDSSKSGKITKQAFVDWYMSLVDGIDKEGDSLNSDEREDEKTKAKSAFAKFAKMVNGRKCIDVDQFGELIESLGTTYCEEQHIRTVSKLERDGNIIYEDDFLTWYIDWLFGRDDDSDEEDNSVAGMDSTAHDKNGAADANKASLCDLFKVDIDSWKCEVCSVRNNKDDVKCSACETPKPGSESSPKAPRTLTAVASVDSKGSIGSEGFSFGRAGAGGSIGTGGFTFGSLSAAPSPGVFSFGERSKEDNSTTGVSFGSPQPKTSILDPTSSSLPEKTTSAQFSSIFPKPPSRVSALGTSTAAASTSSFPPSSQTSPTPFSALHTVTSAASKTSSSFPKAPFPSSAEDASIAASNDSTLPSSLQKEPAAIFAQGTTVAFQKTLSSKESDGVSTKQMENNPPLLDADTVSVLVNAPSENRHTTKLVYVSSEKASEAFDQCDTNRNGFVPVTSFGDILEILGEGFHGDEYDTQLSLVDSSKSGKITKQAFVDWYTSLVDGIDKEGDSLNSDEREDEKTKAKSAFAKFAKMVNGRKCIDVDQFGELIESLGTTYCEEQHIRTVSKLERDGNIIYEDDFLTWYIDWLFGRDDDSDEEDNSVAGMDSTARDKKGAADASKASLGDLFKVDIDSWKCEVCSVRNNKDDVKCSACETPKPGSESSPKAPLTLTAVASVDSKGSIGSEGFSFGRAGAGGSIGTGGFTFGSPSAAPSPGVFSFGERSKEDNSTTGVSFGSPQPKKSILDPTSSSLPEKTTSAQFSSIFPKPPSRVSALGTSTATASTSSFPPSSQTSPTPFSALPAVTSADLKTSSCFPQGPFPSSANDTSIVADSISSSSRISQIEQTPFSAHGTSAAVKSSTSFHPSSQKKPIPLLVQSKSSPFSAQCTPNVAKNSSSSPQKGISPVSTHAKPSAARSSSSFPPTSQKAPTPFSAQSTSTAAKQSSSFPPSSQKAPTPFSTPGTLSTAKISSSFPPSSQNAPTPFSVTSRAAKFSSSFPPSSQMAPTSFSAQGPSTAGKSCSAFPPVSDTSPTPVTIAGEKVATMGASTVYVKRSAPFVGGTSSEQSSFPCSQVPSGTAQSSNNAERNKSEMQLKFEDICAGFQRTLADLSDMNRKAKDQGTKLRSNLEGLASLVQHERAKLLDVDECLRAITRDVSFFEARKTDLSRQIEESNKLIENTKAGRDENCNFVETHPLDMESEHIRRKFASLCWKLQRRLQVTQGRLISLEATRNGDSTGHQPLLYQVMRLYKAANLLDSKKISLIFQRVESASAMIVHATHRATGQSSCNIYGPSLQRTNNLRKVPLEIDSKSKRCLVESRQKMVLRWRATEKSLSRLVCRKTSIPVVLFYDQFRQAAVKEMTHPSIRKPAMGLLMSPERLSTPQNSVTLSPASIFSPPSSSKVRDSWDNASTSERDRVHRSLSIVPPHDLKQTTLLEASHPILSRVGTSAQKLQTDGATNRSEFSSLPKQMSSKPSSAASFPPSSSIAPSNPFSSSKPKSMRNEAGTDRPPKPNPATPRPMEPKGPKGAPASKIRDPTHPPLKPHGASAVLALSEKKISTSSVFSSMNELGDSFVDIGNTVRRKGDRSTAASFDREVVPDSSLSESSSMQENKVNLAPPSSGFGLPSLIPTSGPLSLTNVAQTPASSGNTTDKVTSLTNNPHAGTDGTSTSSSPFGNAQSNTYKLFGSQSKGPTTTSPFGSQSVNSSTVSPFGSQSGGVSLASPFGSQSGAGPAASPFGASSSTSFGTAAFSATQRLFNGKTAKELLTEFYQQRNPKQLSKIDSVLEKYKGKEEVMFRNLAHKYNVDPALFGISANVPPAVFGSPSPALGFGQSSALGGGPSPFGQIGNTFGQPSSLGTGTAMANAASGHTFGSGVAGGTTNFGSLAQSAPSPFGSAAPRFGGGETMSSFASPPPSLGSPFGAPRR